MLRQLIERCLNRERSAFNEFIQHFEGIVREAVRMRLKRHNFSFNLEDVKDITQNIFLEIWEKDKLRQIRDRDKIQSWLAIVSQNAAVDYIRRNSQMFSRLSRIKIEEGKELDLVDQLASANIHPLEELTSTELQQCLEELIAALPSRDRLIITLNLLHNQTHQEIATLLKIPRNSVSTIIRRTKERLKRQLQKRELL